MEAFPSPVERTAASALLLLSTFVPSLSPSDSVAKCSSSESLAKSTSKSCSSSVISEDRSSAEIRAHGLRFVAVIARRHEMKLKMLRKSRSKNFRAFACPKMMSGKTLASESETTETSSCLSSGSSAISSGRSRCSSKRREVLARDFKRKPLGSAVMSSRAEAILKLLSDGCASEVRIRQLLGDSPDTSKALRMLLKMDEVKRTGAGGRNDPYIYKIA